MTFWQCEESFSMAGGLRQKLTGLPAINHQTTGNGWNFQQQQ
jgi:hypothetical protein